MSVPGTRPATARPRIVTPVIDVVINEPAWKRAVPGVGSLCRRAARAAIAAGAPAMGAAEACIVLTDDGTSRTLNRQYRNEDKPTNVLSFPLAQSTAGTAAGGQPHMHLLGDVVVAFATSVGEAESQAKSLADHLTHLVVHGILHLVGHDHQTDDDATAMERLEVAILATLGVEDPYHARDERCR